MAIRYPVIPENIIVHLGKPNEAVNNVTVPFVDYISKPVDVMKLDRMLRTYLPSELIREEADELRDEADEEPVEKPQEEAVVEENMVTEKTLIHINRTIGLQYCLDEDLYRQVLESYLEQGKEDKETLPDYYNTKKWRDYAIVAHAIKSSSLSIGAVGLSELAKTLEFAGKDENCANYISFAEKLPAKADTVQNVKAPSNKNPEEFRSELQGAVIKGLKDRASSITSELLKTTPPMNIVQEEIIPALNTVGVGFEEKKIYLPQLLMSAEAAKAAFECIKASMPSEKSADKCTFIIATVKGDIHDIGKNIVKLLLENYGFDVVDLGRDVPPEEIVSKAVELRAPLVGLSALMTTTVPAMEETIKRLRLSAPWCKVVVGGAVLTREYAERIGADKYAADAMETVRYAQEINKNLRK